MHIVILTERQKDNRNTERQKVVILTSQKETKMCRDGERQKDRKTERQKDRKTERQKTERQIRNFLSKKLTASK